MNDWLPAAPLLLIMHRGNSGGTGGGGVGVGIGGWVLVGQQGKQRRAGVNYLLLAHGSPAERQALTFGTGAIGCIQHSVTLS